jgi:hypothetical protein
MHKLTLIVAAAAALAGCGGSSDSKKAATPEASSAIASAPAKLTTPGIAACPTPPPGPPSAVQYSAPSTTQGQAVLTSVQAANGTCTDIATFTFAGSGLPAYEAKYAPSAEGCGSGIPVTTAGAAKLTLRLEPAVAHDESGNTTVNAQSLTPNLTSIRELKLTCDFEGVVAWVIGTEPRYYKVTTASSPSRIIFEVYQ